MKKKLKGYIFSRSFLGESVPQKVQNLVIRQYCEKNNYEFQLSAVEYAMDDCHLALLGTLKKIKKLNGIVMYSLFQLPEDDSLRNDIYKKLKKEDKQIHFALENYNLNVRDKDNLEKIENIWLIRKVIEKQDFNWTNNILK